jgi:predicted phosphoribosyltransferase
VPLDVVLVRKIRAPGHPELGLGAVVDGHDPQLVLNEDVVAMVQPTEAYIEAEGNRQLEEIERRRKLYRDDRPGLDLEGRTVIVVDDGIATGGTVKAVLKALSRAGAAHLVLAVPVAPQDTLDEMWAQVDEVVCLAGPEPFYAVGAHYANFSQTSDTEVVELLRAAGPQSIATGP